MPHGKFFLGKHLLPNDNRTPLLRQWLLLLAECLLFPALFMLVPIYWYWLMPVGKRDTWYALFDTEIPPEAGIIWQVEVTRWLLFTMHLVLQVVLARRISRLLPQLIAAWTHLKASLNLNEESLTSPSWIQLVAECAGYFANFVGFVSLYLLSLHLFKTDPKERLWQFFLQSTLLLCVVISGGVALEKVILHNLVLEFHRTVYQERVYKCMWANWVVKTLRSYVQFCRDSEGGKLSWQPRVFPSRPGSDLLAAFLLESSSARGQKKQAVEEISSLFGGQIDESRLVQVFRDADVAKRAFILLSEGFGAGNDGEMKIASGMVDRERLGRAVGSIYKERQDLIRALSTHANIVTKLDRVMLTFLAWLVLYFGVLPIFGYSSLDKNFLLPLGISLAPIYNISRVIGRSIQSFCEAIVYIVSSHPYDVGDRVTIDGVDFYVHEIGLIATTFRRFDGFIVYIPNYVLSKKVLLNIRRTGPQAHRIEILVDMRTPINSLQSISDQMKSFIRAESRDYESLISSFFELKPECNHLALVFLLRHRFNFQDPSKRSERINKFLLRLKEVMEDAGVQYEPPVMKAALEGDLDLRHSAV